MLKKRLLAAALALLLGSALAASKAPKVVLDAGHGGIDPGMVSQWVTEKEVTLDIALKVQKILQKRGVGVKMVRTTDKHLSPDKATDLGLRSKMAAASTVAAYVSIHVNASSSSSSAQGIETYYFGEASSEHGRRLAILENGGGRVGAKLTQQAVSKANAAIGDILAQTKLSFSRQLANKVQRKVIAATGAVNRGVQANSFYVIRHAAAPAILIEVGFGSHPREGALLAKAAYRDRIAQAIAAAILEFLHA